MDKKDKKKRFFKSKKVNRMLDKTVWFWVLSSLFFNLLRFSSNPVTDEPSGLSTLLKEYNPVLACLPIAFGIFMIIKLIEFYLIYIKSGQIILEDSKIISWLIKNFHMSYKSDQLILKDETILLGFEFLFCILGFFYELKWYLLGAVGMVLYFCLYIALNFKSIKKL